MRPSQEDFHPGKYYDRRIPKAIWDWPINYETLAPYYQQAEALFQLSNPRLPPTGRIADVESSAGGAMNRLRPINEKLVAANRAHGLEPFRLPLAIDFARCLGCAWCPGFVCPTGARRSTAQLTTEAMADGAPLTVLADQEVETISKPDRNRLGGVAVRDRKCGKRAVFRAKRYVLAAGAIGSAAILLRSGMGGPLVGRHYMLHLSPIALGIFPRPIGADTSFVKEVGFADYYFGTKRYPHKMGIIQSLPVPGPLMLAKAARLPPRAIEFLRRRMLPLAGIVEDLPDPTNRVSLDSSGQIRLRHRFAPYDLERGRRLSRLMSQMLKRAGAVFSIQKTFGSEEHVAHQCGTLRFGNDSTHSVLDPDCRLFDQPDVFVVDGSFLPTSLGVGPALTIIANALRVSRIVTQEV